MKPLTVTGLIFLLVVSYTVFFYLELNGKHVSGAVNYVAGIGDSLVRVFVPEKIPRLTIITTDVEQYNNEILVYMEIRSESSAHNSISFNLSSYPSDLFRGRVEKRVISAGINTPSFVIKEIKKSGNYQINVVLYTLSGERITDASVFKSIEPSLGINEEMFSECDSAKYCKESGLGSYCWGRADGKYSCHDDCANLLNYAPSADNCCQNICTIIIDQGMCSCKS